MTPKPEVGQVWYFHYGYLTTKGTIKATDGTRHVVEHNGYSAIDSLITIDNSHLIQFVGLASSEADYLPWFAPHVAAFAFGVLLAWWF